MTTISSHRSFGRWFNAQQNRDDDVGLLARDLALESGHGRSYLVLYEFMLTTDAGHFDDGDFAILDAARAEYGAMIKARREWRRVLNATGTPVCSFCSDHNNEATAVLQQWKNGAVSQLAFCPACAAKKLASVDVIK